MSTVKDSAYVKEIRQYRRSEMVSLAARWSPVAADEGANYKSSRLWLTPWGVADVASVSLSQGDDHHNRLSPRDADLERLLRMHNQLEQTRGQQDPDALARMMLQLAFQQFPFQRGVGSVAGRTMALLSQTQADEPSRIKVIKNDWQFNTFGCTLAEYVGGAQLAWSMARAHKGQVDLKAIQESNDPQVTTSFPPEITLHVVDRHLARQADDFRIDSRAAGPTRRFYTNPLIIHPLVDGLGPHLLAPALDALIWKTSPTGIYFTGQDRWGKSFADDLGELFQSYIGRHLRLMNGAVVQPEIRGQRSVDWIVVFPNLVLLVEVKSAQPVEPIRIGGPTTAEDLQKRLGKAGCQLDETYTKIIERHEGFDHIPHDRPVLGLTVTLEDFHVINTPIHRGMLTWAEKIPSVLVSADELEQIVCLGHRTEQFLLDNISDKQSIANLRMPLSHLAPGRNPILAAGLETTPLFTANLKD